MPKETHDQVGYFVSSVTAYANVSFCETICLILYVHLIYTFYLINKFFIVESNAKAPVRTHPEGSQPLFGDEIYETVLGRQPG